MSPIDQQLKEIELLLNENTRYLNDLKGFSWEIAHLPPGTDFRKVIDRSIALAIYDKPFLKLFVNPNFRIMAKDLKDAIRALEQNSKNLEEQKDMLLRLKEQQKGLLQPVSEQVEEQVFVHQHTVYDQEPDQTEFDVISQSLDKNDSMDDEWSNYDKAEAKFSEQQSDSQDDSSSVSQTADVIKSSQEQPTSQSSFHLWSSSLQSDELQARAEILEEYRKSFELLEPELIQRQRALSGALKAHLEFTSLVNQIDEQRILRGQESLSRAAIVAIEQDEFYKLLKIFKQADKDLHSRHIVTADTRGSLLPPQAPTPPEPGILSEDRDFDEQSVVSDSETVSLVDALEEQVSKTSQHVPREYYQIIYQSIMAKKEFSDLKAGILRGLPTSIIDAKLNKTDKAISKAEHSFRKISESSARNPGVLTKLNRELLNIRREFSTLQLDHKGGQRPGF